MLSGFDAPNYWVSPAVEASAFAPSPSIALFNAPAMV